jgi:hypothetical protein
MKRLLAIIFGLFITTAALPALAAGQAGSPVGVWDFTVESPQGKRTSLLTIKKEGEKLMGAVKGQRGERPLDSLTLNGSDIKMVMTIDFNGQNMVITYTGKVAKDSMKGEADFGGLASGEWSAVTHKEGDTGAQPPAAPATGGQSVNVTGIWNFTVETPQGSGNPVFTFKQEGESLTGSYKGQLGEAAVKGTVKGNDIKFSFKVSLQGQDAEIEYSGKVEGNTMKGLAKLGELGEAPFTAKKQ